MHIRVSKFAHGGLWLPKVEEQLWLNTCPDGSFPDDDAVIRAAGYDADKDLVVSAPDCSRYDCRMVNDGQK